MANYVPNKFPYNTLKLALSIRGKVKDWGVYRDMPYGIVYSKYVAPYNVKTPAQLGWRVIWRDGNLLWQGFNTATKNYYNKLKYPIRMSGWDRWQKMYLKGRPNVPLYWADLEKSAISTTKLTDLIDQAVKAASSPSFVGLTLDNILGIGVVPKIWDATIKAIQLGGTGSIAATTAAVDTAGMAVGNNAFFDDTHNRWEYIIDGKASLILQQEGYYEVRTAVAGLAGNEISWGVAFKTDNLSNFGFSTSDIEAWGAGFNGVNLGGQGFMFYSTGGGAGSQYYIGHGLYYDGAWKYRNSANDLGCVMRFSDGNLTFYTAVTGANNAAATLVAQFYVSATGTVLHRDGSTSGNFTVAASGTLTAVTFTTAYQAGITPKVICQPQIDFDFGTIRTHTISNTGFSCKTSSSRPTYTSSFAYIAWG